MTKLKTFELLERLPVPMFVKARDGRYLGVNKAWEEMFGMPAASFVGKEVRDLYPQNPEIAALHAARDRELWERPGAQSYPTQIVTPDGRRRDTIYYKATFPSDGEPEGLVGAIFDVTARARAESALRESEERFRAVVDSANEGMLIYDRSLNIIAGNRAAERIVGLPLAQLIGKPGFTSLLPCVRADGTPLPERERPTRATVRSGKALTDLRIGIQRAGGAVTWLSVNTAFLRRVDDTDYYGLVSTITDVTEQTNAEARLKESEARFRQTFELAASGICHVVDGRFVRVNRSLCEILGYTEKELLGKHVKDVSHPEDRDVTDADRARIRAGELDQARFEKRYLRRDGSVVWCDLAIALVRDVFGMPLYEIAVFDDITNRKTSEAALHAAHEELKRSNAELEQFAYVASHDLQEPLRMVASYTQLLGRRYEAKLDKDAREFMSYIVDGATRMKQLIEDLLAYSRVGTKGQEFKPVALEAPLRRALFNLRTGIEEAGAAVTYDPLPTVQGDEVQLGQLLQNLVGNALKFRSNSVPRIHLAVTDSPQEWTLEVRDNGIGIEPQYFERIFMVFQRLHNKGEYPGTGIGLAICKKVVERHGGRIWVESRAAQGESQGSSFFFTLPKRGEH
jgi:PAS domain S-box-containing protein